MKETDIEAYTKIMEEMAEAPRDAFPYKREPGEMNTYEKYNHFQAIDRNIDALEKRVEALEEKIWRLEK